jgi:hypothetical protein
VKPIPLNPETEAVARRVVWFEEPAEALADPIRFMAYAMASATHADMKLLRRYVPGDDFREAPAPPLPGQDVGVMGAIVRWFGPPVRQSGIARQDQITRKISLTWHVDPVQNEN